MKRTNQPTPVQKKAIERAKEVMENSYSPYSDFSVGACLYSGSGDFIEGTNFENASYGLTICAERTAILRANAIGLRKFKGIVVISNADKLTAPCGACRQVILELAEINENPQFEIVESSTKLDAIKVTTISELLPWSFGPSKLGIDPTEYQ